MKNKEAELEKAMSELFDVFNQSEKAHINNVERLQELMTKFNGTNHTKEELAEANKCIDGINEYRSKMPRIKGAFESLANSAENLPPKGSPDRDREEKALIERFKVGWDKKIGRIGWIH